MYSNSKKKWTFGLWADNKLKNNDIPSPLAQKKSGLKVDCVFLTYYKIKEVQSTFFWHSFLRGEKMRYLVTVIL